jgi:hypothetical protein
MSSLTTYPDPYCVAVSKDGLVYIASDGNGAENGLNGAIVAYKNGQFQEGLYYEINGVAQSTYGLTFDQQNNAYINFGAYNNSQGNIMTASAPFRARSTFVTLNLANPAFGVKLDGSGNLLTENSATGNIDVYQNGTTTPATSYPVTSPNSLAYFDLTYARDSIFFSGSAISGTPEFAYPSGTAESTINPTGPSYNSVVIAPAAQYPPPYNPPGS